jgi:cytochrome c556
MAAALTISAGALGFTAVFAGDDDETPLHKLMTSVQKNDTTILKGTRTAVNYKKQQEDVVAAAKELAKLGAEAKKFTEPAKEKKVDQKQWEDACDAFTKEVEKYSTLLADKATDQPKAKAGYREVKAKCTSCHEVFQPEEG